VKKTATFFALLLLQVHSVAQDRLCLDLSGGTLSVYNCHGAINQVWYVALLILMFCLLHKQIWRNWQGLRHEICLRIRKIFRAPCRNCVL